MDIRYIGPVGEYSERVQYSTIDECLEYCQDKMLLGEDIETTRKWPAGTYKNENIYQPGLDPYLSQVVMLQIGDIDRIYVIDTRSTDISILKPLWENEERLWVGHNLKFEAKHLLYNYGIIHHNIWDTMLCDQNLYNGMGKSKSNPTGYRFSLEALSGRYLNIKPAEQKDLFSKEEEEDIDQVYIDKSIRMGFLTIGNKLFTEDQILYGANDVIYPIQIRDRQLKGTGNYNPREVHTLENKFCLVLADIELKGIAFSKEQWLKNYDDNLVVYNRRLEKLNQYVEAKHPKFCAIPDLFNPDSTGGCTIKWSSSDQVVELFKDKGICPKEKSKQTGKIEYTVGATALQKLLTSAYKEKYEKDIETDISTDEDLILNYLLYKVSEQACTTFGKEWLKYIHPITGRVHSEYKQILHTGRISSNKPNLQNIPQDHGYRKAFTVEEGYKMIDADYSGQESRVLAELSGDEAMIGFFNNGHPIHGDDYHSFTATKMFSIMRNEPELIVSKKTHPEERNAAKSISFKIAYGGSAYTLKDDFGVAEEVAQEFIDGYMRAFPALDEYFKTGRERAVKQGYIEMLPDRRYWEPDHRKMVQLQEKAWSWYPKDYSKMSQEKKAQAKAKINQEHPEIKEIWREFFIIKGALERISQNFPIQSAAASQTKNSCNLLRKYLIDNQLQNSVSIISLVHDEVIVEAQNSIAEEMAKKVEEIMITGAQHYCSKVKMAAATGIDSWWSH